MEYVSPQYQQELEELAGSLVTVERFGDLALSDTIEFEPIRLVEPVDPILRLVDIDDN